MANISSPSRQLSYKISYGLFSGPAHAKRLHRSLQAAGYRLADDNSPADILIAHSAGCWNAHQIAPTRLTVYVGMPTDLSRPFQTWRLAHRNLFRQIPTASDRDWFIYIIAHNIIYGLKQPVRNYRIVRQAKRVKLQPPQTKTVLIANQHDVWTQTPGLQKYLQDFDWTFVSLSGSHNTIWQQPDLTVDIINHHAADILAQADHN